MRTLDRYLLREFLMPFGYCLVGFTIFWISFDVFAELPTFQKRQLQTLDVFEYYFYKMPELLCSVIVPITLLLALLYALTNHARHHELTAIRAAGVSLARISMPYFAVGFLLSLLILAMNETWVPKSLETTDLIMNRYETNQVKVANRDWEMNFGFNNTRANRSWIIQGYNRISAEMIRPHVEWTLPDGTRHQIYADWGRRVAGQWVFTNVQEFIYPPEPGRFPIPSNTTTRVMSEISETPEEIEIQIKIGKIDSFREARKAQLSIREILLFKSLRPDDHDKDTLLHGRLAAPWTCLVVVMIALPFGAVSGRRNVFVGVASSILICFAYFVFQQSALALGLGGKLPAWLAGWSPNFLFAAIGIFWSLRLR